MSKKRKIDKKKNNSCVADPFNQMQRFSEAQWEDIIAAAIRKAEKQKEREVEEKDKEEWAERKEKLGFKDFSRKPFYIRWLFEMIEYIRLLVLQMKKDVLPLSSNMYTKMIVALILGIMFGLLGIILICGSIWITVRFLFDNGVNPLSFVEGFVLGLISFLFGTFFILAEKEIICTKDSDFVFSTFSAMTSIIAIVIAIIALVIK